MSTATYTGSNNVGIRHYFADVSNAARAFAAALFAAQERQFVAQEVVAKPVSGRTKEKSRLKLLGLANQYQDIAPSLSAEFRCIASRD
jgi:hypothetical protein